MQTHDAIVRETGASGLSEAGPSQLRKQTGNGLSDEGAASPNFGLLLAPVLSQVDATSRPRFLALLERAAADRYREWAAQLPSAAEVLLACAAREDEISDRIEAVFEIDDAKLAELHLLVPEARSLYYAAFDGMSVLEQIRVQSDAELQGATAWRSVATAVTDARILAELAACSELEELSSVDAKAMLATHR